MKVAILAAGAAGMICGSCLRDNLLAGGLMALGHDVTLVPLYTPLRTDLPANTDQRVYFGGLNVYLDHVSPLYRRMPRWGRWLLDRPGMLRLAGRLGADKPPGELAALTRDVLLGAHGPMQRETDRLLEFLGDLDPDIVTLPNLMFTGLAEQIHQRTGASVVCELTGEDIFLDAMPRAAGHEIQRLIHRHARHVDAFVATSKYYAEKMSAYIGIDDMTIDTVYPGVPREFIHNAPLRRPEERDHAIGYLARICREKGIDQLAEAFATVTAQGQFRDVELRYAGYASPEGHRLVREIAARHQRSNMRYLGEVDAVQKVALLDSVRLFCVPTAYAEAKGMFVLEALARGTPVLAPAHGSFVELARETGAIALTAPNDTRALAASIVDLLSDFGKLRKLSAGAHEAIRAGFTVEHMAQGMLRVFERARESRDQTQASRR